MTIERSYWRMRLVSSWLPRSGYVSSGEREAAYMRADGFMDACEHLQNVVRNGRDLFIGPITEAAERAIDAVLALPDTSKVDALPEPRRSKIRDLIVSLEIRYAATAVMEDIAREFPNLLSEPTA